MPLEINTPRTEAYYEGVRGWPSQYSFIPDGMISLNNRFFTFRNGSIWEHNISPDDVNGPARCTFYNDTFTTDQSSPSNSKAAFVEFLMNEAPETVKNFKTIAYEGEGQWSAVIATDEESTLQSTTDIVEVWSTAGTIEASEFENKEGKMFAWIRGVNESELDFRDFTVKGISPGTVNASNITFSSTVDSSLTVGDELYFFSNTGTAQSPVYSNDIRFAGVVTAINDSVITFSSTTRADGTAITQTTNTPESDDFFVFSKDRVTETSGLIGFFAIIRMTNTDNTRHAELFAVESEIFGSSQ